MDDLTALPDGAQEAVGAVLPEGPDLGEPGRAQCADVDGELRALRAVMELGCG
jgi:hypothetical protein